MFSPKKHPPPRPRPAGSSSHVGELNGTVQESELAPKPCGLSLSASKEPSILFLEFPLALDVFHFTATFRTFTFKNLAMWHLLVGAIMNQGREMATCSPIARLHLPQTRKPLLFAESSRGKRRDCTVFENNQSLYLRQRWSSCYRCLSHLLPGRTQGSGRDEDSFVLCRLCWKMPAAQMCVCARVMYDGTRVKSESNSLE